MDTTVSTHVPSIDSQALHGLVGMPSAPLVVDVRKQPAFDADPRLVPGAIRRLHDAVDGWAPGLDRGRPVVVYCVQGHQISQGVAEQLRGLGFDARILSGGVEAWRASGAPTVRAGGVPGIPGVEPSRWVTRERPKIDRIACPWLVRRFIDSLAEFHYVPSDRVLAEAEALHAIPYDVPRVQLSHRGEQCTFDAMLADFALAEPALAALATIVRGADTARLDLAPQSPGLLAFSLGLSVLYPDDHEMLEQGMKMYDALYAWLRSARDERHDAKLFNK